MGALAELIPQVFFDFYARYVPGLVLFGSWILLLGQDDWQRLLETVAGGHLDSKNALPVATLILLFVPFVVGYVIAPFAKIVQRGNEHGWWLPPRPSRSVYEKSGRWRPKDWWVTSDKGAGRGYDWLRANHSETGAYAAKIRAEFTMHNALSVAFAASGVMAWFAGEHRWAVASGLAAPVMAWRGAKTEETFQDTTRKLCKAKKCPNLGKDPRLIWLMPVSQEGYGPLWEDGKGWLKVEEKPAKSTDKAAESTEKLAEPEDNGKDGPMRLSHDLLSDLRNWGSPKAGRDARKGKDLVRELRAEDPSEFEFRMHRSWGVNLVGRGR